MANTLGFIMKNQGRKQIWLVEMLNKMDIGRDITTVNKWCKGHHDPRDRFVRNALSEILGVPHDDIFPDSIAKPPFEEEPQPEAEPQPEVQPQPEEIVQKTGTPEENGNPTFNEEVETPAKKEKEEDNIPDAPQGDGDFNAV